MTSAPERPVVLIADNDENDVFLIKRAFGKLNSVAPVVTVDNGEAVLAYLKGEGEYSDRSAWPLPGILLLDQWMPRLSGHEVLSWIRTQSEYRALPVVILSGGQSPGQIEVATRLGAACCPKQSDLNGMVDGLNEAISAALRLAWESSVQPSSVGKHVLVVDDDPAVLESLGLLISHVGHTVETAQTGVDALRKIDEQDFDLVFTDLQMPHMTGEELAREIKNRHPGLPVIMVSGRRSQCSSPFLPKPFSLDQLRQAIGAAG